MYIIHIQGEIGMFCTKCGAKNPEDATFCYKCGNEMYKTSDNFSDNSPKASSIDFISDNKKVGISKNIEKELENELTTPEERELSPVLKAVFELFIVGKERREVISRNDFWLSQVVLIVPIIILLLICYGLQWVGMVYAFYILYGILMIDATIRRLHDTNKSGAYILIGLIPVVGQIILLVLLCLPRVEENNQWIEKQKEMLND